MSISRVVPFITVGFLVACSGDPRRESDSIEGGDQIPVAGSLQAKLDATQRQLDSVKLANERRVADSIHREQTMPRQLALFDGDTLHIKAPQSDYPGYSVSEFSLASRGNCHVAGRLETVMGGNRDVTVALFRRDDFINWQNNERALGAALYAAGPQSVATFDVPLKEIGSFVFVISNRFSSVTEKVVVGGGVVTCIGSPVPVRSRAG